MKVRGLYCTALLVAMAFATSADAADVKALKKQAKKQIVAGEFADAISTVKEIGAAGGEDAIDALFDLGTIEQGLTEKLYEAVAVEMVRQSGVVPNLLERYNKVKSKPDFRDRVFITDIMTRVNNPEARAALIQFLDDGSDFVRGAAVSGLAKSKHADGVLPLIKLLEELSKKKRDVLYDDVRDALYDLTGEDYELIEDWKNWWEAVQGSFDPKKLDTAGKTGVRKKKRGEEPEFFEVPVTSKHIVFVIDSSESMKYVMKTDIPGLARGDGSDSGQGSGGGQMTPEDQKLAEFWTRMEMAKRELQKVVKSLDPKTMFNIVQFNTQVDRFKKQSVPANPQSKKDAEKYIESIKRRNFTATMDALVEAFSADPKTNAIFFLSDGIPSKDGKSPDSTSPILDRVFDMNRFRKIKIHTFGFFDKAYPNGEPYDDLAKANSFLRELAAKSGGKFTDIKVDPSCTPEQPYGPPKKKGKEKDKEGDGKEGDGKDGDGKTIELPLAPTWF
ncbi:MAG: hypothetical protein ACKVX7_17560 [Planctomycetota bacterium]